MATSTTRDDEICTCYESGSTLDACGKRFGLSRERIRQILKTHAVQIRTRQPGREKDRDAFVGINVRPETKDALKEEAERRGVSVSKLLSDQADRMTRRPKTEVR